MPGRFCNRLRLLSNRTKLKLIAGAVLVPAAIVGAAGASGVRLNLTNSVPIGLYLITESRSASLVEFCPPEPFGTFSRERGYREQSRFGCADGAKPLLKRIAAKPGDLVAMSPDGIAVNRRLIAHTAPLHTDTVGRAISAWPFGLYVVRSDTIWVASSFNTHSFDSRYFGPVPESAVLHHLRPLWVSE